ncbi:hypothetical protein J4217_00285 [Candidatus Pacearchaeota archaeon]|nr:hypothetical protein [Candidatus Pacearchaeota archaeon]
MEKEELNEKDEVMDEIESSLKDPRGLASHQKRLAFCLSLGITNLIEEYLKKKNVLKQGHRIDHQWFKRKKDRVREILSKKITSSLESLDKLDLLFEVAFKIESKRNDLAYGGSVNEEILKNLIDEFLNAKKRIENE